jgi:hypothetical protein
MRQRYDYSTTPLTTADKSLATESALFACEGDAGTLVANFARDVNNKVTKSWRWD